jgi:Tol biopolymer transport system component
MNRRLGLAIVVGLAGLGGSAAAQRPAVIDAESASKLPLRTTRTVSFTTTEGTWMALDVSPDGRQIIFDLLGDLYVMPITGGDATRLTSGPEWEVMPRYSRDGREIVFISDRDGTDNIWTMELATGKLQQVTREVDVNLGSPEWSPDGEYIVARHYEQYPQLDDYRRVISLWLYDRRGGGGVQLHRGTTERNRNSGVSFSPDGRYVYFASDRGAGRGPVLGIYQVMRLDRTTGDLHQLTSRAGGALRPIVSPDGRYLVYATRRDAVTALRIRDLATQEEEWLVASVQRDDQQGYAVADVFPGYAFTPDSRCVVFTAEGHIQRVDIATKAVTLVPFTAYVEQALAPRLMATNRIEDGPFQVRQLHGVTRSPDGASIAFSALGQLWIRDASGRVRRLTEGDAREYQPAFSPDGRWIAYITWSDSAGGHLWRVGPTGGNPVLLTPAPGFYRSPVWTPDGDRIVYSAAPVAHGLDLDEGVRELRWTPFAGGEQHTIAVNDEVPVQVSGRGSEARVYYVENTGGRNRDTPVKALVHSIRLDGLDQRLHLRYVVAGLRNVAAFPSRDGRWLLLLDRDDLYLMPLARVGAPVTVRERAPSVTMRRVTRNGANFTWWSEDSRSFGWSFTNHVYHTRVEAFLSSTDDDWNPSPSTVQLTVPRARPKGALLFRGARIITAKGDEVIERGDLLIENGRIAALTAGRLASIPPGTMVMDVSGKTIIPGFVDLHAHPRVSRELMPSQGWSIAANFAYGVTTSRIPSGNRIQLAWAELLEAGLMIGSRVFGAGQTFTSVATPLQSQEDAFRRVRLRKLQGSTMIKQYLQPRRIQRQWVAIAAAREGLPASNEGGVPGMVVTMALDGYTGMEHNIEITPVYRDWVELFARSQITYTPAMITTYGSPQSYHYWRARSNFHDDAKLRRFVPHQYLDEISRRVQYFRDEEHHFPQVARVARDILRAGGNVALGTHGDQQGIGVQWELWNLAAGGMTPLEVIRVATIMGAESMGLTQDIGSLEPGKLADLQVLDGNPLRDIRETNTIRYMVKNGLVFDGHTLDQVWPESKPFPTPYWRVEDAQWEALHARDR